MLLRLFLSLIFLFSQLKHYAQTDLHDNLTYDLGYDINSQSENFHDKIDSYKIVIRLNHLSKLQKSRNIDNSLKIAQKALELSKKNNFVFGKALSLRNIANAYNMMGMYTLASKNFFEAMEYFQKSKSPESQALAILMREQSRTWLGQSELSFKQKVDTFNFAINQLKKSKDYLLIGELYDRLSKVYFCYDKSDECKNNLEKSLECLKKASEYFNMINYTDGINGSDLNIGITYLALGDIERARPIICSAIKSAEQCGNNVSLSVALGNFALVLIAEQKLDSALIVQLESFDIVKKLNWAVGYTGSCSHLMDIYAKLGKYKEAFEFAQLRQKMQDSVVNVNQFEQISQIQRDFELKSKDQKIDELNILNRLKSQQFIILIILLTIVIISLFFWFYSFKKKQKILELENLIRGQENERKRLAADLHDGLGVTLSALKMAINYLNAENNPNFTPQEYTSLQNANSLAEKANQEIRFISHNLVPPLLLNYGLGYAISSLVDQLNSSTEIKFIFDNNLKNNISDKSFELNIYRIVLELVHNVLKHSNAKNSVIQIFEHENYYSIVVEDDGIGFVNNDIKSEGLGLENVKNRVKSLNGKIEVDTGTKIGSILIIDLPKI